MNKHLLLVHAHPDDESIGQGATMARYVAEGVGVTLVTCTGGEMGEILVPELEHMAADKDDTLADQRKIELDQAMKTLGVTDHRYLGGFKRYRDSGMKWHEDGHAVAADDVHENAFWHADLTEAASHLVEVIREVRPQVMVTYDEFGGYGHPDHIQAHRVATYAASLAAVPSYRPDLGEAHDIAKIYWGAMSASKVRQGLRDLRAAGDLTTFEGMDPDGELPAFMVEDDALSALVEAEEYAAVKMEAMKAHRTQIEVDGPFFALVEQQGQRDLGDRVLPDRQGHPRPDRPRRSRDRPVRRARMTRVPSQGVRQPRLPGRGIHDRGVAAARCRRLGGAVPLRRRRGPPQRERRGHQHRRAGRGRGRAEAARRAGRPDGGARRPHLRRRSWTVHRPRGGGPGR